MRAPLRPVCIELCIEEVAGVAAATAAGADRVELCSELQHGGLSPELAGFAAALDACPAGGMQVLIRSRAGDFVYDDAEIGRMADQITAFRTAYDAWCAGLTAASGLLPAAPLGFVVGAITPAGEIDEQAIAALRAAAGPHGLTFHRAFDSLADHAAGLERLVTLGFERVLTTGGRAAAADVDGLRALTAQADGRIGILVSGGLRSGNVAAVVAATGAREIHMRSPFRDRAGTDPREARRIVEAVRAVETATH